MFSATEIQEMPKNNKAYSWYMVAKLKHCIQLTDVWSILVKEMINIAFSLLENCRHCILLKRKWRTLYSLDLKMANIAFSLKENGEHCILFTWRWPTCPAPDIKMSNIGFSWIEKWPTGRSGQWSGTCQMYKGNLAILFFT